MTHFITHAPADAPAAEALQKFLERRGLFVERETGERGFRPLQNSDRLIVLWSKDAVFSPYRLQVEKRALDAWAEGRLVLVKLDHQFAPVGLRDLDFVDATFDQQRELVAFPEIAKRATAQFAPPPAAVEDALERAPPPQSRGRVDDAPAEPSRKRGGGGGGWGFLALAAFFVIVGAAAAALMAAVWSANRIGPTPGGFDALRTGVDAVGVRYGLPDGAGFAIAAGAIVLGVIFVLLALLRGPRRTRASAPAQKRAEAPAPEAPAGAPPAPQAVFVSYARADAPVVLPVCEAVKRAGSSLWLDKEGIEAGDSWAGEIVRAIKMVKGVAVMCSKAAFESDHVKREIYLADRYKKRLLPVFIEDAPPPEDFEYFFAGVQWLKLHETPEADRGAVMARALEAV